MSAQAPLSGYTYTYFNVYNPTDGVAHVEINRPKKLNAFSEPVWLEFGRIFTRLSEDENVRAVVLSGSGDRAFTAGLDVQASSEGSQLFTEGPDAARKAKGLRSHIEEFQGCIGAVEKCEKPVIVVLHGIALGLAIDIACCADIRIAASNTRFAVKEVDIGIPADIGTLTRLPKIVGNHSWVKEVCLTARDFSAAEAKEVGFVGSVRESKAAALQAALDMAGLLASKSPVAVQGTKELLNHGRDHATVESLRYTAVWNSVAVQSEDFKKGIVSGLKKTKPTFAKL
ncbi:ClpP/crotonase-like domain-containing protein [Emericellopsis atlantica]|uniref:ClpP/crotonase-like domain-containing protein n=1 Tax=Emericellopsis atlantica TaxID=2614577 RepID=A0A9P7ZE47_9HYPO|nr:ClpP/crotonase-like domain-containing protein [Emericellopsis atlantica]KAG9250463.1 ClpP/crotonase-like domain-containing protein [Emericellopsis atlantica]